MCVPKAEGIPEDIPEEDDATPEPVFRPSPPEKEEFLQKLMNVKDNKVSVFMITFARPSTSLYFERRNFLSMKHEILPVFHNLVFNNEGAEEIGGEITMDEFQGTDLEKYLHDLADVANRWVMLEESCHILFMVMRDDRRFIYASNCARLMVRNGVFGQMVDAWLADKENTKHVASEECGDEI